MRRALAIPRVAVLVLALVCALGACGAGPATTNTTVTTAGHTSMFGVRTKTSGCTADQTLPDLGCTPGAIFPNVSAADVCQPGYASSVRNVSTSLKDKVYAAYGITSRAPGEYAIDHLINLSIGGSNDLANLWPERTTPLPGNREKDAVENYLHDQVCSGQMSLPAAQVAIATNWLAVFQQLQEEG